ncbi:MAG: hypothetical protein P1P85_04105, partial [Patescibacteria group bacterium]|nr:hypothetical protein [Patescibacteria group bacterium]
MKNTGIIIKYQEADYIAGTLPYEDLCDNWTLYLPTEERQHSVYFDTMACVTFSALNIIETQLNFLLATNKIPEIAIKELTELGYIINNKFEFSDRFTAKMSGTTRKGNYLQKVWDSIKHGGLLPESDWAYPRDQRTPIFDWDDYYQEIPQELKDKAKKILDYFDFAYEWEYQNKLTSYKEDEIENIKRQLRQAPLQIASPTCNWKSDVVEPCGKTTASHATMIYQIDNYIYDYDSYEKYIKKLSLNYIIPWI